MNEVAIFQDLSGKYELDGVWFEDLGELMRFAERHQIQLADNEYKIGYKIGALIVALSECPLDKALVLEALAASTDTAYSAGARALENILAEWRLENS